MPTIKKNNHRPHGLNVGLFYNKTSIRKRVLFQDNCRYILPGVEQLDVNKLFGLGYFWNIHKESARFGWRYVPEMDRVLIFAYCYVNGKRIEEKISAVRLNFYYEMKLEITANEYVFYVRRGENYDALLWDIKKIPFTHRKKLAFPCGLFFGGNNPAPQTLTVDIKSLS